MAAAAEQFPPSELGEFSLTERLGEGGSGVVYAAWWHDRPVALKVLKEGVDVTDKERARFVEEATKIRAVLHPALVTLLDAGTLPDGRPYLAMPRLHGETLHQRALRGALPLEESVATFTALAAGVAALHDAGIVHRDIKPENVFLEETDAGTRPILLDFGIARDVAAPDSTTTQSGVVRGTPAYMAPERFFGSAASVRTDVYELAVTLYVMLTGSLPWAATSGDASARLDPPPPSAKGAEVPAALEAALLRAMSTRPEARPVSVAAFARAVEDARRAPAVEQPRRTAGVAVTVPPPPMTPGEGVPDPLLASIGARSTTGASFVSSAARPAQRTWLAALGLVAVAGALGIGLLRRPPPEAQMPREAPPGTVTPPIAMVLTAPASNATSTATTGGVPLSAASYVIPPRYLPRPRLTADAGAAAASPGASADPSRFYQDRK